MTTSHAPRRQSPGPFRADQIRDGDPYELSNGHAIRCMSSGDRHATSNAAGALVIATDPAVERVGVDAGCAFNEGQNLRAPDIVAGHLTGKPGWAKGAPPLAIEYADKGQDEADLQDKIAELLEHGTRHIWVVRLVGPLRVEVYEPGQRVRTVDADGELRAPGILDNPVSVQSLVDPAVAKEVSLRNLLNAKGYANLDAVREEGLAEGEARGLREAVYAACQLLDIQVTKALATQIEALAREGLGALLAHLKTHRTWPDADA